MFREDIARSQVFQYGVEWSPGVLEQAMTDALINNRWNSTFSHFFTILSFLSVSNNSSFHPTFLLFFHYPLIHFSTVFPFFYSFI